MITYQRLVNEIAEIPDVRERATQVVDDEARSALRLLHAVIKYERQEGQESAGPVHYHGNGSQPYYRTAMELGLLRQRKPSRKSITRWPRLASTAYGRRTHSALEREGYYSASSDSVSTEAD